MSADSRDVSLAVPAKPGYLVLARLALAAVCRLTALQPAEVADLKLAVTEAAGEFVTEGDGIRPGDSVDAVPALGEERSGDVVPASTGAGSHDDRIDFAFRLEDDRLVCELSGCAPPIPAVEQELSRAIIEATVDSADFSSGHTVLVKNL